MTIPLTGSTGLFVRSGHILAGIQDAIALVGASGNATARVLSTSALVTRFATIAADFVATADQTTFDGAYSALASFQSAMKSQIGALNQLLQAGIIRQANDDTGLTSQDLKTALTLLASQMQINGTTVNSSVPSVGAQTAVGTPVGNAIIVSSVLNPLGLSLQYMPAEKANFACSLDSYTGGATAGQEQFAITSPLAVDPLDYRWPTGTGINTTLSLVDGSLNNSGGNVLQNSDYKVFTNTNVPDNWALLVGVATTNVVNGGSGNAYTPSGGSLEFIGDGATLAAITQAFNTTPATGVGLGGTSYALLPLTQYAVNGWVKMSVTPAAGVLEFSLIDGNGATITDAQSNNNLFTKSLTAVSTTFVNFSGTFRTPATLPTTGVRLQVRQSTAITNGKNAFIGRLSMTPMSQLYTGGSIHTGGPWCALFSGSIPVNAGFNPGVSPDSWFVAYANTLGGFQQWFQRLFNMQSMGIQIPNTAAGPTVADSLIT